MIWRNQTLCSFRIAMSDRRLHDLPHQRMRMEPDDARRQAFRHRIVQPVFDRPLLRQLGGPRLVGQPAFQAPADVDELLADLHVEAAAGRARPVVLGLPDARQIRLAANARRRRGHIHGTGFGSRHSRHRVVEPLRADGRRHGGTENTEHGTESFPVPEERIPASVNVSVHAVPPWLRDILAPRDPQQSESQSPLNSDGVSSTLMPPLTVVPAPF